MEERRLLAADSGFFLAAPATWERGTELTVVAGYHDQWQDGRPAPLLRQVRLSADGDQLTSASFFSNEIPGLNLHSGNWWYCRIILPSNDLEPAAADRRLDLSATFRYWPDTTAGSIQAQVESGVVEVVDDWPDWEGWSAGDVHVHTALTDTSASASAAFGADEWGGPLTVLATLGRQVGLGWLTATDHSFELDTSAEPFLIDNSPRDPDVFIPWRTPAATPRSYTWEQLESEPMWSAGPVDWLKGEEISINAPDRSGTVKPTAVSQYHLLAYGFDAADRPVSGPGALSRRSRDAVFRDLQHRGRTGTTVFAYVAHPKADDAVFAEPWTVGDVVDSLRYHDANGQRLLRGLEFWNGGGDSTRDASLSLWESVLARNPDNRHWYLAGGSDDHLSQSLDSVGHTRLGDVRTVVYGATDVDSIRRAFYGGRSIVTDGPLFSMGVDRNRNGSLDGGDILIGQSGTVTAADRGTIRFDWPEQSQSPWGQPAAGQIKLFHYRQGGSVHPDGVAMTDDSFDAYADWAANRATYGDGWQVYRAELTVGGHRAYSNPVWVRFEAPPLSPPAVTLVPQPLPQLLDLATLASPLA